MKILKTIWLRIDNLLNWFEDRDDHGGKLADIFGLSIVVFVFGFCIAVAVNFMAG